MFVLQYFDRGIGKAVLRFRYVSPVPSARRARAGSSTPAASTARGLTGTQRGTRGASKQGEVSVGRNPLGKVKSLI